MSELSVLQWNVWFKEDIRNISRFIGGLKQLPDVFTTQELTRNYHEQRTNDTAAYLQHALGYSAFTGQEIAVESWQQMNGIFSRYPIAEERQSWLYEPDQSKDKEQYRGLLRATLDVHDTPVDVWTTQLRYFDEGEEPDFDDDPELQLLAQAVDDHDGHLVLTGDFNMTPDTGARHEELTKRLRDAGPSADQKTWSTKWYEYAPVPLTKRYDFIMVSAGIEVVDASIMPTDISDHLPIYADLRV